MGKHAAVHNLNWSSHNVVLTFVDHEELALDSDSEICARSTCVQQQSRVFSAIPSQSESNLCLKLLPSILSCRTWLILCELPLWLPTSGKRVTNVSNSKIKPQALFFHDVVAVVELATAAKVCSLFWGQQNSLRHWIMTSLPKCCLGIPPSPSKSQLILEID